MPEDITSTTVPGADSKGNPATEGKETASDVMSLKEINEFLGKDFKDRDTALSAIKETYKYVGSVGQIKKTLKEKGLSEEDVLNRLETLGQGTAEPQETVARPEKDSEVQQLRKELERDRFYKKNPELESYGDILNDLQESTGLPLSEIATSDKYKPVFEKLIAQDKAANQKRVLESNPRLGRVRDKMQEAKKTSSDNPRAAQGMAVEAVMDAFEQK